MNTEMIKRSTFISGICPFIRRNVAQSKPAGRIRKKKIQVLFLRYCTAGFHTPCESMYSPYIAYRFDVPYAWHNYQPYPACPDRTKKGLVGLHNWDTFILF